MMPNMMRPMRVITLIDENQNSSSPNARMPMQLMPTPMNEGMRMDLATMVDDRRTEDENSGHPCIWWDSFSPPFDDNLGSIDLERATQSWCICRAEQRHTILGQRKSHIMR